MQTTQIVILVCAGLGMFALLGLVTFLSSHYNLDGIKSKTVGDGQYGTARFATNMEIKKTYSHVNVIKKWKNYDKIRHFFT
jgi:type IV secretion system protein VirD4